MTQINHLCETIYQHTKRRFHLIEELGKGATASVFLVQSDKQEKLALKVIQLKHLKDHHKERMFKEVEIMAALKNHDNIVTYKGHFFIKNKLLCIFLSYCQGQSLAMHCKTLPLQKVKTWMAELSSALAFVHQKGIIHQDIKLENIFLQGNSPKIGDFGLATKIEESEGMSLSAFRGTPYYMAPEILENKAYSPACDVWGLGLVFLELILGKRIHHMLQGAQIPCRRPKFPEELLQYVQKPEMRTLISLMLKRTPSSRPTAAEVVNYLFNPGTLTCQPAVNVHLKSSRCCSELKVIKYSDSGVWERAIVCEECGKEAILRRQIPLDEQKQNLMDRLKISRQRLYKAGYGAKWQCSHCKSKGFWLVFQQ